MTEAEFLYYFKELVNELNENYIRGELINVDVNRIDELCKQYLNKKNKLYKKMGIENPLNGSD